MSKTIIENLQEALELFAAYGQEIWPDQCEWVQGIVRDFQKVLVRVCSLLESMQFRTRVPIDERSLMKLMVDLHFIRKKADDICLALAAYAPHGRSKASRYVRKRHMLVDELQKLLEAIHRYQAWPSDPLM